MFRVFVEEYPEQTEDLFPPSTGEGQYPAPWGEKDLFFDTPLFAVPAASMAAG